MTREDLMRKAIELSKENVENGGGPFGAVIATKDGEIVAGISSYSGYHGGIEIEVVTREDYRRKGLACIGGARMLLECEKRGLYPNWDAANKMSVGLAEKLGYHFSHEYYVYKVHK